jgi:hypothetical protein
MPRSDSDEARAPKLVPSQIDYNNLTFNDLVNNLNNKELNNKYIFVQNNDGSHLLLGKAYVLNKFDRPRSASYYNLLFTNSSDKVDVYLMYPRAKDYKIISDQDRDSERSPRYILLNTATTIVVINRKEYQNKFIAKDDNTAPPPVAQAVASTSWFGGKRKSRRHKKSKSSTRRRRATYKKQ